VAIARPAAVVAGAAVRPPRNNGISVRAARSGGGFAVSSLRSQISAPLVLLALVVLAGLATPPLCAQTPRFGIQWLTNREVALSLSVTNGPRHRIAVSSNLVTWNSLVTLPPAASSLTHTDSATPFVAERYYRSEQVSGTNFLLGDHLATTNGDVVIQPLYHASFVMSWNGKIIYSDPDDDGAYESRYAGLPSGDLILVTHEHGDHYSTSKLTALRAASGVIIVPQRIYNMTGFAGFRANAIPLAYGVSTNVMGMTVEAVPGYDNSNHTYTNNNSYVITLGGRRIFISGDTSNTPQIRALTNIDVAFLCMNLPFTMNIFDATNCVRAMRPRIVYPYHYRESGNVQTNASSFKRILGTEPGIEVRLRNWY